MREKLIIEIDENLRVQFKPEIPKDVPQLQFDKHGNKVIRRIIKADNSCLFNSFGLALQRTENLQKSLRELVAREILKDSEKYTEVVLEK